MRASSQSRSEARHAIEERCLVQALGKDVCEHVCSRDPLYVDFEREHSLATVLHPCLKVFRTGCHARFLDRLFSRLVVGRAAHDAEAHCASSKMHAWSVAFASRCMVLEWHRVRICI